MCARVPLAVAQFVLKIEKLSRIIGTAPIAELARACGLHPRLWLLDWLIELFNNKMSNNKLFNNKLSDISLASELVENRSFLNQSQSRKL